MSEQSNEERAFPIQNPHKVHHRSQVPESVYMKAYEVYSHVYSPQPAMIEGECRGGFEVNELIAFLYASSTKTNLCPITRQLSFCNRRKLR